MTFETWRECLVLAPAYRHSEVAGKEGKEEWPGKEIQLLDKDIKNIRR